MFKEVREWLRGQSSPRRRKRPSLGRSVEAMEQRLVLTPPVLGDPASAIDYSAVPGPDQPLLILSDATAQDSENNFGGGTLVAQVVGATGKDKLAIGSSGNGISTAKKDVLFQGEVIGKFSLKKKQLTVNLNDDATTAAVLNLLQSITYLNTAKSPGTVDKTVNVQVADGAGESSNVLSKVIHVEPSFDGSYSGSFRGRVTVEDFGSFPIPNPVVFPASDALLNITIAGDTVTVSLPGLGVQSQGTLEGTTINGSVSAEFEGIEVVLEVTGELKSKGKTAQISGTWAIKDVDTNGILLNGTGTWSAKLDATN